MRLEKQFYRYNMIFIVVALLALTLLVGCSKEEKKNTEVGGADGVFTIAYAPNESTDQSQDARNGLA